MRLPECCRIAGSRMDNTRSIRESRVAPCVIRAWSLREPCVVTGGSCVASAGTLLYSVGHQREIRGTSSDTYMDT